MIEATCDWCKFKSSAASDINLHGIRNVSIDLCNVCSRKFEEHVYRKTLGVG